MSHKLCVSLPWAPVPAVFVASRPFVHTLGQAPRPEDILTRTGHLPKPTLAPEQLVIILLGISA